MISEETRINPWILISAFAVLVGPFALAFHMHYPDEIYYRDAAIKMLQNGDYLTTYLGSGELRFKKPILTYWAVLGGFKIFGVYEFASRFFFLIAGALTVGLTYALAKVQFQSKKIAGISALIMAANPVLILASSRSIPDVLLVLTMTGSAIGVAGLLRYGDLTPKRFLWLLYISLGLAFEVKGLPAAALGVLAILYLLFNPWNRISWKTLLHFPSLLIGTGIALYWFVAMWKIHGPTYLDSFLEDQVGIRVASRILLVAQNGLIAFLILVAMFIPWIFLGLPKAKITLRTIWKEHAGFFGFALLWGLAILAMGAMTSKFYERYLLPVAPVLAVWLGWFLVRGEFEIRKRALKTASIVFWTLNLVVMGFSLWLLSKDAVSSLTVAKIFLAGMVLAYLFRLIWKGIKLPKATAYSFLVLFLLISTVTDHISFPHQGEQFQQYFKTKEESGARVGFMGNLHTGSKIRMSLYPKNQLIDLPSSGWETELEKYPKLIVEDKFLDQIDTEKFQIEFETLNWESRAIPELLKSYGSEEFDSLLKTTGEKYYLLTKK